MIWEIAMELEWKMVKTYQGCDENKEMLLKLPLDLWACQVVFFADKPLQIIWTQISPTKCRARSRSKLSDNLMIFLKQFLENVNFKENQQMPKSMKNYAACKELPRSEMNHSSVANTTQHWHDVMIQTKYST